MSRLNATKTIAIAGANIALLAVHGASGGENELGLCGGEAQQRAEHQVAQSLKFEMLIPVRSAAQPTACMSFNYHREHFGEVWGIDTQAGEPAHTACVAFGIDRLAVALFAAHGVEVANWPASVKANLGL